MPSLDNIVYLPVNKFSEIDWWC